MFVFLITGSIYVVVASLLVYTLIRYRSRGGEEAEPPQVFGSIQIELAWTIIPVLIIVVLFLATARVIFAVQDAEKPASALNVVVIGHQFWWEFRYPQYNVVTANELHVPLSDPRAPTPTFLKLTSADVIHSFWIPRLAGKTELLPNRVNEIWIDPHAAGMYDGQCAQFCGAEHAKMLLRVYVDTPAQFRAWIANQQAEASQQTPSDPQQSADSGSSRSAPPPASSPNPGNLRGLPPNTPGTFAPRQDPTLSANEQGRRVFEQQACVNCHTVRGTIATGRFGPDLTHLMSRQTIAAGAAANTPDNLTRWITNPDTFKPGVLMPPMHLTDQQNQQITAYLTTLR